MAKYLFFSILLCLFMNVGIAIAQPKGSLAPKERDIEDAPEDSVAGAVYIGMSYAQLTTALGELKNYSKSDPLASLQAKEKKLRTMRDMAWRLVLFMEDPIKKRVAESAARESHRVVLLKEVESMKKEQAAFEEDRAHRIKVLDSLTNPVEEEAPVAQEGVDADGDGWVDEPSEQEETPAPTTTEDATKEKEGKKKNTGKEKKEKKEDKKKTVESKKKEEKSTNKKEVVKKSEAEKEKDAIRIKIAAERQKIKDKENERKKMEEEKLEKLKQENEKKEKAKLKQDEKLQAKSIKQQEKFIEKEQIALDKAYDDSIKIVEGLQVLEDSMAHYTEDLKAFEDSTEQMRKDLKPVKELSYEIRKEWVKLHHAVLEQTDVIGSEAEADFNAIIDDFHNDKIEEILKLLDNAGFIDRIKTLRDNLFLSKKLPNLRCESGIGNFMKVGTIREGATDEEKASIEAIRQEIEQVWEQIGRQTWEMMEKNKNKTREVSPTEYKAMGRSANCVGYILGLGDDCNLVILKLIDESKIAIVCKKNKEDDMSAIKLIK